MKKGCRPYDYQPRLSPVIIVVINAANNSNHAHLQSAGHVKRISVPVSLSPSQEACEVGFGAGTIPSPTHSRPLWFRKVVR